MKTYALLLVLSLASSASAQPPGLVTLAEGGCAAEIDRYRAVQANDLAMGHVAKSVYAQIQREIAAAEKVCAAGQDAKAMAMIRASQVKHGYPTHI